LLSAADEFGLVQLFAVSMQHKGPGSRATVVACRSAFRSGLYSEF